MKSFTVLFNLVKLMKALENTIGSRSDVFTVNFEHTQRSIQYIHLLFYY